MTPERVIPGRAAPAAAVRPTRAEVSLSRLRTNFHRLGQKTRARVWAVVKADAYGHGARAIGRTLEAAGCPGLCVALLEEGLELRAAGITLPILVMGGNCDGAWHELLDGELTPVLTRVDQLRAFAEAVERRGMRRVAAHLKLDTGMGRLGATAAELPSLAQAWAGQSRIRLEGLMTHFASADTDPGSVADQLRRFEEGRLTVEAAGLQPSVRHAANTAAMLRYPEAHFDRVRPGIGLYGLGLGFAQAREFLPVMRVRSEIVALRDVPVGGRVGYGGTWTALRPSRIATAAIGYADGLLRSLSGRGHALVRGRRVPIVGAISMDMCSLDVTDAHGAGLGDEVVVLGEQQGPLGQDSISAEEIAAHAGTIPWEILTAVSRRVPRFYRED